MMMFFIPTSLRKSILVIVTLMQLLKHRTSFFSSHFSTSLPIIVSALAAIEAPDVCYDLHLPDTIVNNALLSSLQLETVIYASQRHQLFSPDGMRLTFPQSIRFFLIFFIFRYSSIINIYCLWLFIAAKE